MFFSFKLFITLYLNTSSILFQSINSITITEISNDDNLSDTTKQPNDDNNLSDTIKQPNEKEPIYKPTDLTVSIYKKQNDIPLSNKNNEEMNINIKKAYELLSNYPIYISNITKTNFFKKYFLETKENNKIFFKLMKFPTYLNEKNFLHSIPLEKLIIFNKTTNKIISTFTNVLLTYKCNKIGFIISVNLEEIFLDLFNEYIYNNSIEIKILINSKIKEFIILKIDFNDENEDIIKLSSLEIKYNIIPFIDLFPNEIRLIDEKSYLSFIINILNTNKSINNKNNYKYKNNKIIISLKGERFFPIFLLSKTIKNPIIINLKNITISFSYEIILKEKIISNIIISFPENINKEELIDYILCFIKKKNSEMFDLNSLKIDLKGNNLFNFKYNFLYDVIKIYNKDNYYISFKIKTEEKENIYLLKEKEFLPLKVIIELLNEKIILPCFSKDISNKYILVNLTIPKITEGENKEIIKRINEILNENNGVLSFKLIDSFGNIENIKLCLDYDNISILSSNINKNIKPSRLIERNYIFNSLRLYFKKEEFPILYSKSVNPLYKDDNISSNKKETPSPPPTLPDSNPYQYSRPPPPMYNFDYKPRIVPPKIPRNNYNKRKPIYTENKKNDYIILLSGIISFIFIYGFIHFIFKIRGE